MSTQPARMLKQAGQQAPETKPVLEVKRRARAGQEADGSVHFHDLAHIPVRPGPAGRKRPEDPAALRQAGERLAGLITVNRLPGLWIKRRQLLN